MQDTVVPLPVPTKGLAVCPVISAAVATLHSLQGVRLHVLLYMFDSHLL